MRILLGSPPAQYGYVNLCYRYVELGEVAGYLQKLGHHIQIADGLVLTGPEWTKIVLSSLTEIDVLILHHSGENIDNVLLCADLCKQINPDVFVATYGITSTFSAVPFIQRSFDAIVIEGDWEVVLADWLFYLENPLKETDLCGVLVRSDDGQWIGNPLPKRIAANEWSLPVLDLLPLEGYKNQYTEKNRIAGFQGSFELSLSVSRGCPYNCWFCPSGKVDGNQDRRRPVVQVIEFLKESIPQYGFNQFAPFSATFTLDRDWVLHFCSELQTNEIDIPWRCVTTLQDLDDKMLLAMRQSGCQRVGVGVESLNPDVLDKLRKTIDVSSLSHFISKCRSLGIIPLCFLMCGLPGQAPNESQQEADQLKALGAHVRISELVNYGDIKKYRGLGKQCLARKVEFIY